MKKRLFCFLLTVCMCISFQLSPAAAGEIIIEDELQEGLTAFGTLVETNSPAGAVGIAYDITSGTTRYYGVSGNTLSNANLNEPLTVPGWFPEAETSAVGGGDSANGIIGSDDRTKVTNTKIMPYSAIVFLEMTFPSEPKATYSQTAFLISENIALTAAHGLYRTNEETRIREWATSVKAIPGKYGKTFFKNPYGSCEATELVVPVPYYENADKNYDWGIIRLDEEIGTKTGYFGYQFIPHSMVGMNITITGYPYGVDEDKWYSQWTQSGEIIIYDENAGFDRDYVIDYLIDTEEGQSGSPIYRYYDGAWTVVGIHAKEWYTGDDDNSVSRFNQGVRFTSQMFSFIRAYQTR